MGISRHRAMHRDKKENCSIRFTNGEIIDWKFKDEVKK